MEQNDSIQKEDLNQTAGIPAAAARVDNLTILKNLLEPKRHPTMRPDESDSGREVKLKDAYECIDRFKPTMAAHGITMTGRGSIPKIANMRKITESEEFQGKNLLEWMVNTVNKYDPDGKGKNMGIRLMLGIYDNKFLTTYFGENSPLMPKKQDRITIFLVPYRYNDTQRRLEDEDATAYDLGGLQP